ncbi:MAG TPA: ribonuclease H-like domain-containing protein [Anaerolineae bacterium]|nr:ribonuclease H-like domain-containing protein [Anaerolineae bacterium]
MNTLFFDLETQNSIDDVGGRHNLRLLKMSIGVTLATARDGFRRYSEAEVAELIAELRSADKVVGFNLLNFDYEVLRAYTPDPLHDVPTVDLLEHVKRVTGFRVGLDALAAATLNVRKSAHGLQAIQWWREGQLEELCAYCEQDVDVTRRLYEFGQANKYVQFYDRNYRLKRVPVNW